MVRHTVYASGLSELGRLVLFSPLLMTWSPPAAMTGGAKEQDLIRVLLADHCSTFRRGLRHALEETPGVVVVGECDTAASAADLCATLDVDVAVVDIDLADRSGVELCRQLLEEHPGLIVLLLSQRDWDVYLAAARAARARGFLVRERPTEELVRAIRESLTQPLFSHEQLERVGQWVFTVGQLLMSLTPRQWDVLWLIAAGMSNRDIAERICISENTVEKHIGAILEKLGLPSRASLMGLILQNHLDVLNPPGQWSEMNVQDWWGGYSASSTVARAGARSRAASQQ